MLTADALIFGARARLLDFDASEHPLALQLGGSDPQRLQQAARIGEAWGYDEINLNVGCPSGRVQSGQFGACLMRTPALVGECVAAMRAAVRVPVTVKCRLGVDEQDPQTALFTLIETCARAGVRHFIIHVRKAWLDGLSPQENRDIPPLDYELVYQLKQAFPQLTIIINGGIDALAACASHFEHVDGVMLGRAVYKNPYLLAHVDQAFFDAAAPIISRDEVMDKFIPYAEKMCKVGVPLHAMTRHIMGLYHAQKGGKQWRRYLSEQVIGRQKDPRVLSEAQKYIAAPLRHSMAYEV